MADVEMKANDLLPVLEVVLEELVSEDPDVWEPVDLTDCIGVDFIMRLDGGGATKINNACEFVGAKTTGKVRYVWELGDTDAPDDYIGEFETHWPASKPRTFPTTEYLTVAIGADLDGAG